MASKLNAGALAAAIRGGFRRFKAGEKVGATDEEIRLNATLESPAFYAAVAEAEATLGVLSAKTKRALAGAQNATQVLRILQRQAVGGAAPPTSPAAALGLPAGPLTAAQQAKLNQVKQPSSLWSRVAMNRQNLFRLAQRGPSQLISSLFGSNSALGFGGSTLAGIAAVKAVTTVFGMVANYNEFRRQGNSMGEALKRTSLGTVQKIATGILNITGVSAGAGDVVALFGGVDQETGRRIVRQEIEQFFETSKERAERERSDDREKLKARSQQLAQDYETYLKTSQSYFDAAPVSDYTVVKSIKEFLGRRGNEARTAVRDIFNRPVWNVVKRAAIEGAH